MEHMITEKRVCTKLGGEVLYSRCSNCPDYLEVHDTIYDWFIEKIIWRLSSFGTVCSRCKFSKHAGLKIEHDNS